MPIDSNFPVVRLIFKNKSHVCSGVFLNAYTILTAAHCVSDKQTWEGQSLEIDSVLDANENKISVKQVKNIPHPDFQDHWYGSRHDLGIIKTTKYQFDGIFPSVIRPEITSSDKGMLYGCGKISLGSDIRKCLMGMNSISFLFGQILSWGKSEITDPLGIDVSVAPNDSGGPLVDKKSNQIVGVLWGTYLSLTSKWGLPNVSLATPLTVPENFQFINANLGSEF